jgi:hypothetical protein
MFAVIGRVEIKAGHEDETRQMIANYGIGMVQGLAGAQGGWWARNVESEGPLVQYSFWLFDTLEHARDAEAMFASLRSMPEAPATFVSVDMCEVIGQA